MSVPEKFRGYASFSKEESMSLKLYEYTPKKFDDHDVDIRITHCGVLTRPKNALTLSRSVEVTSTLYDQGGYIPLTLTLT